MRFTRMMMFFAAWGGLLYLALQIGRIDMPAQHAICGPWGCGPPIQSLLAVHLFWFATVGGGALLAAQLLDRASMSLIARTMLVVGAILIVGVVAVDLANWIPQTRSAPHRYLWQRMLFALVMAVDYPGWQLLAIGGAFSFWQRHRVRTEFRSDQQSLLDREIEPLANPDQG